MISSVVVAVCIIPQCDSLSGISLDQPLVTSCGTGVTACVLALVRLPGTCAWYLLSKQLVVLLFNFALILGPSSTWQNWRCDIWWIMDRMGCSPWHSSCNCCLGSCTLHRTPIEFLVLWSYGERRWKVADGKLQTEEVGWVYGCGIEAFSPSFSVGCMAGESMPFWPSL